MQWWWDTHQDTDVQVIKLATPEVVGSDDEPGFLKNNSKNQAGKVTMLGNRLTKHTGARFILENGCKVKVEKGPHTGGKSFYRLVREDEPDISNNTDIDEIPF